MDTGMFGFPGQAVVWPVILDNRKEEEYAKVLHVMVETVKEFPQKLLSAMKHVALVINYFTNMYIIIKH